MAEQPAGDTRSRILHAALDLFADRGYQRTSLREIADRLRLTKAAILYHFPSKEHLLMALVEPLLADLESALDAAARLSGPAARWATIEGWLDTLLSHRRPLGMLYHDLSLLARRTTHSRIMQITMRANELVAGPDAGQRERIRAIQAIAMLGDPIVFFADVPPAQLRLDMLDGVRRLLREDPSMDRADEHAARAGQHPTTTTGAATGQPGRDATATSQPDRDATATGRRGEQATSTGADVTVTGQAGDRTGRAGPGRRRGAGRPRTMSREQVGAARAMHAAGSHTVDQIAASLGVSRATIYRHLRPAEPAANNETDSDTNLRLI